MAHSSKRDPLWRDTDEWQVACITAVNRWQGVSDTCAMHSGVVGLHAEGNRGLTHYGSKVIKLLINISSHQLACLICRQVLACQYSQS